MTATCPSIWTQVMKKLLYGTSYRSRHSLSAVFSSSKYYSSTSSSSTHNTKLAYNPGTTNFIFQSLEPYLGLRVLNPLNVLFASAVGDTAGATSRNRMALVRRKSHTGQRLRPMRQNRERNSAKHLRRMSKSVGR